MNQPNQQNQPPYPPQQPPPGWQPPPPHGGRPVQPPKKDPRWGKVIAFSAGALLLGVAFGAAGGDTATPTASDQPATTITETVQAPGQTAAPVPTVTKTVPGPKVTVTQTPAGPTGSIPGDGVFEVGVDFNPGTYKAPNPNGDCYWARLKDTSGSLESIVANGNPGGPVVVTIRRTDKAFETARCGEWKRTR